MKVYLFQYRFAPLVESGTKRTTIRPRRKHPTKVGDVLSLRAWTGKPYRSKQRILRSGERCKEVHWFRIYGDSVIAMELDGRMLEIWETDALAKADGFSCAQDMMTWFRNEHGVPFQGELIKW